MFVLVGVGRRAKPASIFPPPSSVKLTAATAPGIGTEEEMASLNAWLNEQIATHNIRVSPRLPIDERVKRFYTAYAAQQGIALDNEDAELCATLAQMVHGEGVDADSALQALYQTESPVESRGPTRQTRQTAIQKCRRSPRLNK